MTNTHARGARQDRGLHGSVALALALGLGIASAFALPPYPVWPLLIPAFSGLLLLTEGRRSWLGAFGMGWAFAFGHHVVGLEWITNAFMVDADRFAWMVPFVVVGLPAGLAIFAGAATLVWQRLPLGGPWRAFGFATVWTAFEWLRGHLLTGFPWNVAGYAWWPILEVQQAAAIFGIWGLTLLTVAAAAMPGAMMPRDGSERISWRPLVIPRTWMATAVAFALIGPSWAGGAIRLSDVRAGEVDDVHLRIVQPNVPQALKWRPELAGAILRQHLDLTAKPATREPTHVIWPESATPFRLDAVEEAQQLVAEAAPDGGILTGSPRSELAEGGARRHYNSAMLVTPDGDLRVVYDKAHLVPFGEYVPLRSLLPVERIAPGHGDFAPGPGRRTLDLSGLPPVGILICYEVIFPGAVTERGNRPSWLLNMTNDAWFGISAGPRQHLAISRMRAIEEGLPLVRAANTGISVVFDPLGRELQRLELNTAGILDTALPTALEATPYARAGDLVPAAIGLAFLVVAWLTGRPRRTDRIDRR